MHPEFHRLYNARHELNFQADCLRTCMNHDVADRYHALVKVVECLFGSEQRLMEDYGFPGRQLHLEQHARVLRALHCVHAAVLQGATDHGRHIGSCTLMNWLRFHEDTVDAAFSVWVDYYDSGMVNGH